MSISDQAARLAALDTRQSFCVSAPAGSGKTELLTQRILALLGQCERPENILAITFTRKAANEMRQRLLRTLRRAVDTDETDELKSHERLTLKLARQALQQDAARGWRLLENPGQLQITTIDSFNNRLASRLPLLSGFGATPAISQEPQPFYEEAVLALFAQLETDSGLADKLAQVMIHLGNDLPRLQQLLITLLGKRDQWLSHVVNQGDPLHDQFLREQQEKALQALIADTLMATQSALSPVLDTLLQSLQYARQSLLAQANHSLLASERCTALDTVTSLNSDISQLDLWRALAALLLTRQGTLRRNVTVRDGFPPATGNAEEKRQRSEAKQRILSVLETLSESPEALQHLQAIQSLPDARYSDTEWPVLQALTQILVNLAGQLSVVFQQHKQCDHSEVALRALTSLGTEDQPTALALRLDYAIQHILVDEFQDTSQMQIDLLERLMRGWSDGDGRSLFIVGDGMQSCYGFRNANVGLFLTARDHGIGQTRMNSLLLEVNFRSTPAVVNWVNRIFSKAFPAHNNPAQGAVAYTRSTANNAAQPDSGIETILYNLDEDMASGAGEQAEAQQVADIVESLQQSSPDSDIAILVKNRQHLRCILPALKARGIAWNATEIDSLGAYPDIRDLMTLTRALLNPADRSAWLGLLRCPFIGLGMSDIHPLVQYTNEQDQLLRDTLLEDADELPVSEIARFHLSRLRPLLETVERWRLQRPLRDWIERCWVQLGGPVCLGEETDSTHIEAFFCLLEESAQGGDILSVNRLQEKLARYHVNSRPGEGVNLQIMTIHKAKGLEFDYVILPRLNAASRSDDPALLHWHEYIDGSGKDHLMLSVPERKGQPANPLHAWINQEKKTRRTLEDTRVLYIAVTRAIRKAWLIASVTSKEDGPMPVKGSLLSTIWDALQQPSVTIDHRPLSAPSTEDEAQEAVNQAVLTLPFRRLSPAWAPPPLATVDVIEIPEPPRLHFNRAQRLRGDIIHDLLMEIAEGRLMLSDMAALQRRHPTWCRRFSTCSKSPEAEADAVLAQLQGLSQSSTAAWLLDSRHEASACELSLSDFRGRWRREAIIDRTFIDQGSRWIIDYKSSAPRPEEPFDSFISVERERYQAQLDWYASLLRAMAPAIPVRTALYFTALDHLEEVSTASEVPHGET